MEQVWGQGKHRLPAAGAEGSLPWPRVTTQQDSPGLDVERMLPSVTLVRAHRLFLFPSLSQSSQGT